MHCSSIDLDRAPGGLSRRQETRRVQDGDMSVASITYVYYSCSRIMSSRVISNHFFCSELKDKLFLFGGRDKVVTFDDFYIFDLESLTWTRTCQKMIPSRYLQHSSTYTRVCKLLLRLLLLLDTQLQIIVVASFSVSKCHLVRNSECYLTGTPCRWYLVITCAIYLGDRICSNTSMESYTHSAYKR